MSSSSGIKIAAGVAVVVVIGLYLRSGQPPTESPELAAPGATGAARNQVEQRLQQLDKARGHPSRHDQPAAGMAAGRKIEAPGGVAANAKRLSPPAAANAPVAGEPAEADLDVDPEDIPALKSIALTDTDPERRLAAVTMLGASEDPAVVPTLAQALSDEDEEVRMAAIQSLSDYSGDASVELLSKVVVDDPSADNRYEALEALSDIGGERAKLAVQKALNDPDEDVRSLAEGMVDMEDSDQDDSGNAAEAPTPAP